MADAAQRLVVSDLRGGRNGADAPTTLKDTQCLDAVNVDWYQATFARKRNGSTALSMTFGSGGPFTGKLSTLVRHVPTTDPTAAELWGVDDAGTPVVGRLTGGTTWSAPTLKDALTGNGWDVSAATINGKLFLAYKSAVGRLHCWDTSTVRRAGLAAHAAAPTVADSGGAGTYAATLRYYRTRSIEVSGGVLVRRSEPSPSVAFTPDGAHAAITITRPTAVGEGETHWEVEASTDDVTYVQFFTFERGNHIAIATTSQATSSPVSSLSTLDTVAATGTYTVQKSYKFIAADQNRLLGFGSYTSTDKQNRIEISAVIGSLDVGDAERVDTTLNYKIDLDENDSGIAMGLLGPVFGNFYAFKDRQIWELTPTGTTTKPYRQNAISKDIGSVAPKAMTRGEDQSGNAALYWMSHVGPYRYGVNGLEYIGRGVEDLILGPTSTINLGASKVIAHTIYLPIKRQVWFWVATGSSNDPDTLLVYDVYHGGWSRFTGTIASARCSVLFSNTVGASMSRDLKPYLGDAMTANKVYKADADSTTDDAGTAFQSYVLLKPVEPGGPGFRGAINDALLLAKAASGVTITATVMPDFDATATKTATASLTAVGSESRVTVRLEESRFGRATFLEYQIGDASAVSNAWTLDRLIVPYERLEAMA